MYKFFHRLSLFMAHIGGLMLVALIILTCVSVVGRSLNGFLHSAFMEGWAPEFAQRALDFGIGPVNGDFELIEAGVAFSIFAFMPLCQFTNSHATVEILTNAMSPFFNRVLQLIIDSVFALVLILIAVQLYSGLLSKKRSGQTTLLLQFDVWWAYAICLTGAVVAAVIAVYVAAMRVVELSGEKQIMQSTVDAQH